MNQGAPIWPGEAMGAQLCRRRQSSVAVVQNKQKERRARQDAALHRHAVGRAWREATTCSDERRATSRSGQGAWASEKAAAGCRLQALFSYIHVHARTAHHTRTPHTPPSAAPHLHLHTSSAGALCNPPAACANHS